MPGVEKKAGIKKPLGMKIKSEKKDKCLFG